jgi:ribonuclease P protein component
MLPKKNRLNLKKQENRKLFRKKIAESGSIKYFADIADDNSFKAAVVVSIKACNKAAHRNKLRRKIYQIIEQHAVRNLPIELILLVYKKVEFSEEKLEQDIVEKSNIIFERFS